MPRPTIGRLVTSVVLAAASLLAPATAPRADDARETLTVTQAAGSGVNTGAAGGSPKTDVAPGGTTGGEDDAAAGRTSKSFGSGHPLAGDQMDERRPDADPRSGENAIDADEPRGPRGTD
jgi:hypothetical protein